jgi:hypothetical protein
MSRPQMDRRDWGKLSVGEQIEQIEIEGYLVLPDLLSSEDITQLKTATAGLDTTPVDYSERQRGRPNIQFEGGAITRLIGHATTIQFLKQLLGDEIVVMTYAYARSEPGHPGISLHTDGQPYGSEIFGFEGSCPTLVRVLYYLDDLTPDVSPFRVIPRSHLSLHADANPYKRYRAHPEEVMVTCRAGSAVLLNHKVFHGNYPNVGDRDREMLAIAYRPAWAGPVSEVDEWDRSELEKLPESLKPLFGSRNRRDWDFAAGNKPPDMADHASGINPSRWE